VEYTLIRTWGPQQEKREKKSVDQRVRHSPVLAVPEFRREREWGAVRGSNRVEVRGPEGGEGIEKTVRELSGKPHLHRKRRRNHTLDRAQCSMGSDDSERRSRRVGGARRQLREKRGEG